MKKKLLLASALVLALVLILMSMNVLQPGTNSDKKTINVTIIDETTKKELISQEYKTNAETLMDFLEQEKELKVILDKQPTGTFINGMLDLNTEDAKKGPWWLYESDNNTQCKQMGFCPAVNDLALEDNNNFTFKFSYGSY